MICSERNSSSVLTSYKRTWWANYFVWRTLNLVQNMI